MKTPIQLSDHFTYRRLFWFTLPSIASMIFASVYGIVDGYFVSNYVGKIPFAGLNIIMPFIMMLGAVGNMIGLGGSALIGKRQTACFPSSPISWGQPASFWLSSETYFSPGSPSFWGRRGLCWITPFCTAASACAAFPF